MIEKFNKKKLRKIWNIKKRNSESFLQIEEFMVTSVWEKFQDNSDNVGGKMSVAHESWRLVFEAKCSRKLKFAFLGSQNTLFGGCGARLKTESWREFFALLVCSFTSTRDGLFSTLYADRKLILQHWRRDVQTRIFWEHIPLTSIVLSDTRSVADEVSSNRKEAERFEFEPLPHASKIRFMESLVPRRSSIRINSSSIGQRLVTRIWLAVGMEDLDIQNLSSTSIR